jgi:16S rRNA processing protein RimM
VVVQLWTDQTQRLDAGTELASVRGTLRVVSSKPFGPDDRYIVQFEGVFDRSAADSLRGVELEAEPLDDVADVLWVHELVGATVRDAAGAALGTIRSVEANPASDLLVLESGGLIPVRFVTAHDAVAHTVDVDIPEGLLDL